jgi:hypothetical protein
MNNEQIVEFFDDKYILDEKSVYITCGPVCYSGGISLGDFVSTVIYHTCFNLDDSRRIILVLDVKCLPLAKLFAYKIKHVLVTNSSHIIEKYTHQLKLHEKVWRGDFSGHWHDIHLGWHRSITKFSENNDNKNKFMECFLNMQNCVPLKQIDLPFSNVKKIAIIYPKRSDRNEIPNTILSTLSKLLNEKNFNIVFKRDCNMIGKMDGSIDSDLSIDELFYLSQNPENIIIINRCGLSEILYRLNVKSKIIVYQPNDIYHAFKYTGDMFSYLENKNITKKFYEIFPHSSINEINSILDI